MPRSKYHARRTEIDGITFDSAAEARRYGELKLMQAAGEIAGLELQPSFRIDVNGQHICTYKADFRYLDGAVLMTDGANGYTKTVYEDVKGMRTPVYRLKKKLVEALYGIEIIEVAQ